jgi:hypothetical protein
MNRATIAIITYFFIFLASLNSVYAQNSVVVPNSLKNIEGPGGGNIFPFDCAVFHPSMRYQQVYLGSEMELSQIISINFRLVSEFPSTFGPTVLPDVRIDLSTTQAVPDALESIFENNIGPDNTTVFLGDLALSAPDCTGTPCPFDITIPLQMPFSFNPSEGNLLLDVRIPNCVLLGSDPVFFNSTGEAGQFGNISSRVWSTDVSSPDGTVDNIALVTQFTGTLAPKNIPTLSEWGLIAMAGLMGIVGFIVMRRRKLAI